MGRGEGLIINVGIGLNFFTFCEIDLWQLLDIRVKKVCKYSHLKVPKKSRISDKNIQLELDRKMCSDIFKSGRWKKAISMLCESSNIT